jgi:hypothetical protein
MDTILLLKTFIFDKGRVAREFVSSAFVKKHKNNVHFPEFLCMHHVHNSPKDKSYTLMFKNIIELFNKEFKRFLISWCKVFKIFIISGTFLLCFITKEHTA